MEQLLHLYSAGNELCWRFIAILTDISNFIGYIFPLCFFLAWSKKKTIIYIKHVKTIHSTQTRRLEIILRLVFNCSSAQYTNSRKTNRIFGRISI